MEIYALSYIVEGEAKQICFHTFEQAIEAFNDLYNLREHIEISSLKIELLETETK